MPKKSHPEVLTNVKLHSVVKKKNQKLPANPKSTASVKVCQLLNERNEMYSDIKKSIYNQKKLKEVKKIDTNKLSSQLDRISKDFINVLPSASHRGNKTLEKLISTLRNKIKVIESERAKEKERLEQLEASVIKFADKTASDSGIIAESMGRGFSSGQKSKLSSTMFDFYKYKPEELPNISALFKRKRQMRE